jgi:hypothetical protein
MCDIYTGNRPNIFIRDKPILLSKRMLDKDCEHTGSIAKKKRLWL